MIKNTQKLQNQVLPSLLASDFTNLSKEIQTLENIGFEALHLDVMDGHFVPNISFGLPVIEAIRKNTDCFLDVHLMISNPDKYLKAFKEAGSDLLTVHAEVSNIKTLEKIKELNVFSGIAINPNTSIENTKSIIKEAVENNLLDVILIMTVEPGFGGQKFIDMSDKIKFFSEVVNKSPILIEVDGGINNKTQKICKEAGANLFVMGSYIFNNINNIENIKKLIV